MPNFVWVLSGSCELYDDDWIVAVYSAEETAEQHKKIIIDFFPGRNETGHPFDPNWRIEYYGVGIKYKISKSPFVRHIDEWLELPPKKNYPGN